MPLVGFVLLADPYTYSKIYLDWVCGWGCIVCRWLWACCPEAELVFHRNKMLIHPSSSSQPLQGASSDLVQSCQLKLNFCWVVNKLDFVYIQYFSLKPVVHKLCFQLKDLFCHYVRLCFFSLRWVDDTSSFISSNVARFTSSADQSQDVCVTLINWSCLKPFVNTRDL